MMVRARHHLGALVQSGPYVALVSQKDSSKETPKPQTEANPVPNDVSAEQAQEGTRANELMSALRQPVARRNALQAVSNLADEVLNNE